MNNPYSQFQDEYSLEQIKAAPMVWDPLTKLQCCPTSDGAGAAIVVSEDFIRKHGLQAKAVEILGMAMTTDFKSTFDDKSSMKLVGYDMTEAAARRKVAPRSCRRGADRGSPRGSEIATSGTARASDAAVDSGCSLPVVAGAAGLGGLTPPGYRPRSPEHGVLRRLVHEHLETFLAEARAPGSIPTTPRPRSRCACTATRTS